MILLALNLLGIGNSQFQLLGSGDGNGNLAIIIIEKWESELSYPNSYLHSFQISATHVQWFRAAFACCKFIILTFLISVERHFMAPKNAGREIEIKSTLNIVNGEYNGA